MVAKKKVAKKKAAKKKDEKPAITWLDNPMTVEGRLWVPGRGPQPAKYMIVAERVSASDLDKKEVFTDKTMQRVLADLEMQGFSDVHDNTYYTCAVKFPPKTPGAKVSARDLSDSRPLLREEIARVKPEMIITLGAGAFKAVTGPKFKMTEYRATVFDKPDVCAAPIFPLYSPGIVRRSPEMREAFEKDMRELVATVKGESKDTIPTEFDVIHTVEDTKWIVDYLIENPPDFLVVDCEWDGPTWMAEDRILRTIQLGPAVGKAIVLEFYDEGVVPEPGPDEDKVVWNRSHARQVCDDVKGIKAELKRLLEHPNTKLVGHNILADGQWLMADGIDIRDRTVYDTMLAEHLINETGPFGLTELTVKYTDMGRYDTALHEWKDAHKAETVNGYGAVPRDMLLLYAAMDVDATRRILYKQAPLLAEFHQPRGDYTSLWETTLATARTTYELEGYGMIADRQRLCELREVYVAKADELREKLQAMAKMYGMDEYNPNAAVNNQIMLFEHLKLTPIQTTKKRRWDAQHIMNQHWRTHGQHKPATNKMTLEILQDEHIFVKTLLDYNRVFTIVKNVLKHDPNADESTRGGGLQSKIWPDERVRAHFSPLSKTGRFRTSKPNMQNYSKRAESALRPIFAGKDGTGFVPPGVRTIFVPPPGYVLMEGDFTQAELFVLAALSGDTTMMDSLTTPGKDMHDTTAISGFKMSVLGADGMPINEDDMLALAARDLDAYETLQKDFTYVLPNGRSMIRSLFKDSTRVAAKNLNFGIPYGRGPESIALQVKAETGTDQPLDDIIDEIKEMMYAWKNETYAQAWAYMMACSDAVKDPGYLVNPWGRKRRFYHTDAEDVVAGLQRQAQNYTIQSTVADTCAIAFQLMVDYRARSGLNFRIVNQIHDAIMLEVPENEIDATKVMFYETMGDIKIPLADTNDLVLGVDIDIYTRWGDKYKAA